MNDVMDYAPRNPRRVPFTAALLIAAQYAAVLGGWYSLLYLALTELERTL